MAASPGRADLTEVTSTSAASKASKTNLFSLPRELRDMVYEYAYEDVRLHIGDNMRGGVYIVGPRVGLCRACKQTRAETQQIYFRNQFHYQKTIFYVSGGSAATNWLQNRVPAAHLSDIRVVRIEITGVNAPMPKLFRKKFSIVGGLPQRGADWPLRFCELFQADAEQFLEKFRADLHALDISLPPGVAQVRMIDKKCEVVWTSEPEDVEIPTYEDLVKFD